MIKKGVVEKQVLTPIELDPYSWSVYVAFGEEDMDTLAEGDVIDRIGEEALRGCFGKSWLMESTSNGIAFSLLYIESKDNISTIVHESLHAIHEMMNYRGIPINYENSEVQAYHLDYLVSQILLRSTSSQA